MKTITTPSAADQLQIACQKACRVRETFEPTEGQKYVIAWIKLAPGVTQPDDYPTLKAAIEEVTGIQAIGLVADDQIPADVGEDQKAVVSVTVHRMIQDIPQAPE